jgi:DNA-binding XRE family transcriptional regulator
MISESTIPGGWGIPATDTTANDVSAAGTFLGRKLASAAQCRAARAMLHWTQADLATRAGIARKTVTDMELSTRRLHFRTRRDITHTLQEAGIEFLWSDNGHDDGTGVRLKTTSI